MPASQMPWQVSRSVQASPWRLGSTQVAVSSSQRRLIGKGLIGAYPLVPHIDVPYGRNAHHIVEAQFKAFSRALREAVEIDPRNAGALPSTKGVL